MLALWIDEWGGRAGSRFGPFTASAVGFSVVDAQAPGIDRGGACGGRPVVPQCAEERFPIGSLHKQQA